MVFLISFNSRNSFIAFNCEVAFTPPLKIFFGRLSVLFVNDTNIKKAINAAKVCGLSSFIGEIDNDDKFILEKSVKDLSSGQKQRLSLARAVYQNRKILILDEPTSNLDKKTEDRFFENIFQVFEKKIIVVVSHNLDNFEQFDKVLIVKNGILNQVEKVSLRKLINLL